MNSLYLGVVFYLLMGCVLAMHEPKDEHWTNAQWWFVVVMWLQIVLSGMAIDLADAWEKKTK